MITKVQDTATVVRNLFDSYNARDMDAFCRDVAPDFELLDVPVGMTFRGPAGMRQWIDAWNMATPDGHSTLVNLQVAGDWAFTEHVGRGTQTGPLTTPTGTIPPTNRRVELHMALVYRLRDGQLVEVRAYWDTGNLMRQLGLDAAALTPGASR